MWEIGDTVVYGTSGVCRILGREMKSFGDTAREYYLLSPLGARQSTLIYVPADNTALLNNIHKVLSKEELCSLLPTVTPFTEREWGSDARAHTKVCKSVLASGDRLSLLRLVLTVFGDSARKPTGGEETAAHRAAAMLYEEFSLVLEIAPEDIIPLILGKITPEEKK